MNHELGRTHRHRRDYSPGNPVIKGTRVPVQVVVGGLAGGATIEEVCRSYAITKDDVLAALAYAAETIAQEKVHAVPHR